MVSKELENSDLVYVSLMADVISLLIIKYRHLSPSGNRA